MNLVIPLALILNELITNAFKYAFLDRENGNLEITAQMSKDDGFELVVRDDGSGLPEGFSVEESDSLGTMIVSMLVEQIHGKLSISSQPGKGTIFHIYSPLKIE